MSPAKYPLPLLCKVLKFIQANYQSPISLKEVAQAVKLSPAYLTDLIRRETGKTVLAWIKEYRMAKARQLLLETDFSIEQITEAVGYLDRRHFNRQFLQVHQLTPQAWRNTRQNDNSLWQIETRHGVSNLTTQQGLQLQSCLQKLGVIFHSDTITKQSLICDIKDDCLILISDDSIQIVFTTN